MWNPQQYHHFEKLRTLPFYDLLEGIQIAPHKKIVDLGCGDGQLTKKLHEKFQAIKTIGVDSSPEMLKLAQNNESLSFIQKDVKEFLASTPDYFDLIFSNACLQWVPDHNLLFKQMHEKGKQLAIQMPANFDFPTHTIAYDIAKEMGKKAWCSPVLAPEDYSKLLYQLGYKEQKVLLKVYPCILDSTEEIVEWVKGSLFSYYRAIFTIEEYQDFQKAYRERVIETFGLQKPFFMPFKRLSIWAFNG